ncbi:MAG: hypothetical protein P1V97_28315 [Planctomycetota bacterium]|nr:hypothetical protein [Planctomycetota bacterium]
MNKFVRSLSIISLFSVHLVACGGPEKKEEEVIAREVTIVAVASPEIAADPIESGDDEIEGLGLLGDVFTQCTTMNGAADKFGGRVAAAGVVIGPLLGKNGTEDQLEDLQAIMDIPAFPTVFVPGPDDVKVGKKLLKQLEKFGYNEDGKTTLVSASGKSGKKYVRIFALDGKDAPEALKKVKDELWVIGILGAPYTGKESIPQRCNLVIAPTADAALSSTKGPIPVLHIPSVFKAPFQFFTLTLRGKDVDVLAWPAQLDENGNAPKPLGKFNIKLN